MKGGEKNPVTLLVGIQIGATTIENRMEISSKKLKLELIFDPAIPLLGIYPEKIMTRKDTCTPMFIAAVHTIAKT